MTNTDRTEQNLVLSAILAEVRRVLPMGGACGFAETPHFLRGAVFTLDVEQYNKTSIDPLDLEDELFPGAKIVFKVYAPADAEQLHLCAGYEVRLQGTAYRELGISHNGPYLYDFTRLASGEVVGIWWDHIVKHLAGLRERVRVRNVAAARKARMESHGGVCASASRNNNIIDRCDVRCSEEGL